MGLRCALTLLARVSPELVVSDICSALLSALDDNSGTDIVDATGTYRVSGAASKRLDSLWIGARFADRTKAVTVSAPDRAIARLYAAARAAFLPVSTGS